MRINYDIDRLRIELIGKVVNWFTIIDVFRDENNHTLCKCQCKCGVIKDIPIKYINSGKAVSCGCYKHSTEYSEKLKKWCKDNPDKIKERSTKYKEWVKLNPSKIGIQAEKHKRLFRDNEELRNSYRDRMILMNKTINLDKKKFNRINSISQVINENNYIKDLIDHNDLIKLLDGDLRANDKINVKCSICGSYSLHNVRDIFNFSINEFKQTRMCKDCLAKFSTSKSEYEIVDFISTFYSGKLVRNTREIIFPLELDLYYPDKNIAIEFNGDYWHSDKFKDKNYHLSKYLKCKEKGILLVSIFESEWNRRRDEIKKYLKDLFNDVENVLSFNEDHTLMNNNYPSPNINSNNSMVEDFHIHNGVKVYTCGYTRLE